MNETCECTKSGYCNRNRRMVGETLRKRCSEGRLKTKTEDVKPSPPNPIKMGLSLIGTVTAHLTTGAKRRPLPQIEEIHNQCKTNECGHYDSVKDRCLMCGCYLKYKIPMAVTKHPRKCTHNPKWQRWEDARTHRVSSGGVDRLDVVKQSE